MDIEKLNFSKRTYNCLKRAKINTVEQLAAVGDEKLMCLRGFGAGCLKEVRRKLGRDCQPSRPVIPGPSDGDHNISELCFLNGKAAGRQEVKAEILAYLMDQKTKALGNCHAHVVDLMKVVEDL